MSLQCKTLADIASALLVLGMDVRQLWKPRIIITISMTVESIHM